ncbi:MAG: potassium-transporting ATPase subunit KdpA, partial [Sulfurospirillaceae bacterium]|nr:potassium-transporting ATPase subunit KdpA [Sulfurospirillaceae bacterium]
IAMLVLFVIMLGVMYGAEKFGNPLISGISGESAMEGKEVRFGIASTTLFATATTAASCGAVNGMHDSFTPIGGLVAMLQMMLGEIVIGGVGAGFYGMMAYVILSVFIAGLMIGRTPEYMGKKIEAKEMTYTVIAVLLPGFCILLFTGLSLLLPDALASVSNPGPHGLSQVLYAFSSASGNNGSAFAGLSGNTLYYNYALAFCMFVGRFGVIIPMLAIAGSLARKRITPQGKGTLNTQNSLFIALLVGTILLTGALTFFPSLALGPVIEHLLMLDGQSF